MLSDHQSTTSDIDRLAEIAAEDYMALLDRLADMRTDRDTWRQIAQVALGQLADLTCRTRALTEAQRAAQDTIRALRQQVAGNTSRRAA